MSSNSITSPPAPVTVVLSMILPTYEHNGDKMIFQVEEDVDDPEKDKRITNLPIQGLSDNRVFLKTMQNTFPDLTRLNVHLYLTRPLREDSPEARDIDACVAMVSRLYTANRQITYGVRVRIKGNEYLVSDAMVALNNAAKFKAISWLYEYVGGKVEIDVCY